MLGLEQKVLEAVPLALAENLLREIGEMRFVARGSSMLPAICPGDEILVRRTCVPEISVGDVVLFGRQGRWFLHRVRDIPPDAEPPRLITQGDALCCPDDPVFDKELLGRVSFLVRNGELRSPITSESVFQSMLQIAVRYLPYFSGALLRWHQVPSGFVMLRHVAVRRAASPGGRHR
jgi:signal peptidase I